MSDLLSSTDSKFRELVLLVVLIAVGAVAFYPMYAMKYKNFTFRAETGKYLRSYTQLDVIRSAEPEFRRGALAFDNRDYVKAIKFLNDALEQDGMHIPSLSVRAQAYVRLNNYQAAIFDLSRIIGMAPKDEAALLLRASLFNKLGDKERATKDLIRAGVAEEDVEKCLARLPDPASVTIFKGEDVKNSRLGAVR